jgi:hypothetical protein
MERSEYCTYNKIVHYTISGKKKRVEKKLWMHLDHGGTTSGFMNKVVRWPFNY